MRKTFPLGLLVIVAAVALCDGRSPQPTASPEATTFRIEVIQGIPVVDGVFLNGTGPYRFMLDTGAQSNQLEERLAQALNVAADARLDIGTVAGAVRVPAGKVANVAVGANHAENQEFLFTPMDGPHHLSPGIRGVLGQEFLSRFDYLLDLAGRRLVFGQPEPPSGDRVNFNRFNGCPAIQTSEGRLVMDSGTNTLLLFHAAPGPKADLRMISTNSGGSAVAMLQDLRLRIGTREYRAPNVAAASTGADIEADGIFPASLFRAIYVSNSGNYVILDPGSH